jgi:hypothetical protein
LFYSELADVRNFNPPKKKKTYLLGGKQPHPFCFRVAALTSQFEQTSVLHKTGSAMSSAVPADDKVIAAGCHE